VFAAAILPRPPLWVQVMFAGAVLPGLVFLFYRFLYHPIAAPIGRDLEFGLTIGRGALLLALCITSLIRRPWDRRAGVE
jgi:hypothetical protein